MSERVGVRWVLGATLGASILIPLALYAGVSWYLRGERLREGRENVEQTVQLLEEHAQRVFEAQELIIAQVDQRIRDMSWAEIRQSEELHRFLSALARSAEHVDGLWLVPPDGRTANSADFFPFPEVDASDRNYFKALSAADELHFGEVIVGKTKGNLNFNLSRRRSPRESFDGLILVTASLDYFTGFWAGATTYSGHVAGLFRPDGEILARYPALDGLPATLSDGSAVLHAMRQTDSGVFTGGSTIYGYSRVADYPLFIGFGIDEAEVLAPWRRDLAYHGATALIAALLLAGLVLLAFGQSRRLAAAMVSWREAAARLQQEVDRRERAEDLVAEKERLLSRLHEVTEERKAILDTMVEGVVAYDLDGAVIYCNGASAQILRLDTSEKPDFAGFAAAGRLSWLDGTAVAENLSPDRQVLAGRTLTHDELRIAGGAGGSDVVCRFRGAPLRDRAGQVVGAVLTFADVTEEKQSEERRKLLMGELDHRVRNMLAAIMAIVRISSGHAATKEELVEALSGRIAAMARTHSRLTESGWRGVALRHLIGDELQPYDGQGRLAIDCDRDVTLAAKDAVNLSLVVHELATNAAKYGAWSNDKGQVEVSWTCEDGPPPAVRLTWRERGGPPVEPPTRRGFGTTIVRSALRDAAEADLRFEPEGLVCEIHLPLRETGGPMPPAPPPLRRQPEAGGRALAGRSVLLVEDEPVVRLELAETRQGAGALGVGPAADLRQARALAERGGFEMALLDINLEGENIAALAGELHERGVPLVFLSGYRDLELLPPSLRHLPRLQKPAAPGEIVALLAACAEAAPTPNRLSRDAGPTGWAGKAASTANRGGR